MRPRWRERSTPCAQHSDCILFSARGAAPDLTESDRHPQSYWVTEFARRAFYRDVDYDAAFLAPQALCLRRLDGANLPVIASYERLLSQRERELVAQRLVSQEYRDTLLERDLEVEALQKEVELGSVARELLEVRLRLVPAGTTRERYFNTAMVGVRKASRVALRGFDLGERILRRSKVLLRGRSKV